LSAFGLGQKKINNILNQDETPGQASRLEQLLSDEETIAECKQQNQRLIEFLGKKENLKQLIKYATRIPEDPNN
jgi:cell shape-determining protein MreC